MTAFYPEQSIRLPETFWCYDPFMTQPAVGPLPALERGHVTFGLEQLLQDQCGRAEAVAC